MKNNFIFNKYYKHLRFDVFKDLGMSEFTKVWINYKRLKFQYRLMQICEFIEKLNMPKSQVIFLHFFLNLFDFLRWKIYDFIWLIANGKSFTPYRSYCLLW